MEFKTDILSIFDKKWALLTAGSKDKFNSMTVSWGGLGTIWGRPAATVYVRTSRYTHEFMDDNDYFTISFYPEECRTALGVFGSRSGREIDKMNYEGLSALEIVSGDATSISFKEAEVTLLCKKMFKAHIDADKIPEEIVAEYYSKDAEHDMYIGEVIAVIN